MTIESAWVSTRTGWLSCRSRPRFAEAILAGVKTVELRRTVPKIVVPTLALLYATTPVRALLGTCIITDVRSVGSGGAVA